MKRLIDIECSRCENQVLDVWREVGSYGWCEECGGEMVRLHARPSGVKGDDIPGGMLIPHGICNPDGTPRRFYSHSEIAKEAARRGWRNHVEHIPARGSDKSRHTSRWV